MSINISGMKSLVKNVIAKKITIYTSYFEKNKHKSTEIWKGINSLVSIKSSKSSNIKLLDENKNLISNLRKISNIFNNHFSTIGSKIEQKFPAQSGNFYDYFTKKDENGKLIINPDNNSFFLLPTDPCEVEIILNALDIKNVLDLIVYLFIL